MQDLQISLPGTCIALVGFGEAGERFASEGRWGGSARGWDLLAERRAAMAQHGVESCSDSAAALANCDVALSLVTADSALPAAREYARDLPAGALWLDMNSVAPSTKRAAAEAVEAAGAHYVDVAIMAPVEMGLGVPLLLAGPEARKAGELLGKLGFASVRVVGDEIGRASAIKLCRSIMVKGLEALTAEMVFAASAAGVLEEVLASLDASEKAQDWATRADYNLERMLVHGRRRAAEMDEASGMLRDLGLGPLMSENTAEWHQALGELELAPVPGTLSGKLDAIRAAPGLMGEN